MKNILLPTDFSRNSLNAMQYAVLLFKDTPCNFYLLNVFKIHYVTSEEFMVSNNGGLTPNEKELYDNSQMKLKDVIEKLKIDANHKFIAISDFNFFIDSVKNYIKSKKIDLIIMGTKGASGAKEIFMGSNTGDVIMKTNCSVLAIPENTIFAEPKEIAFPTDFKISYKEEDLDLLIELAKINNSNLRILHLKNEEKLGEDQVFNRKSLKKLFKNLNISLHTLTNTDFDTAVNCFTQSRGNISMIAILAKHYNFFQRLFFKPKVEELSFHTNIPLLVLHKTK
jgi:nucleotide-binding universal stress UspA family protein